MRAEGQAATATANATAGGKRKARRKAGRNGKRAARKPKAKRSASVPPEKVTDLTSLIASATSLTHSFLSQNELLLLPSQALALESSVKSTAVSLSDLLYLQIQKPSSPCPPLPPPPRDSASSPPSSWFDRFLSLHSDSDARFSEAFHISKSSFDLLLQTLSSSLQPPAESTLAAALFRLSHGASYKSVAHRFGVDSATACRSFYQVCKAVVDRLSHLFDLASHDIPRDFSEQLGLPNCFGIIGHCRFFTDLAPGNDGAVVVQGLVDSHGRFLDVSAGWPGWMAPDAILRQTKLYSRVTEAKDFLHEPATDLEGVNSISPYLLGDRCCPLLPWLLTPYPKLRETEDESCQKFNGIHGRGMELVNAAFARVLVRWKLLSTQWKRECLEFFPFVVILGCLLHNFLIDCGDPMPGDTVDHSEEQRFPDFDGMVDESAENARNVLASLLNM